MSHSGVIHVNSKGEFDNHVKKGTAVVKWSAEWCGPCKRIAPAYEKLAAETKGVTFLHVDVDKNRDVAMEHQVRSMPTFMFWVNGQKQNDKTFSGADINKLQAVLGQLPKPQQAFGGTGYSLSTGAPSNVHIMTDEPKKPQRRRNPWADPDYANKKLGIGNSSSSAAKTAPAKSNTTKAAPTKPAAPEPKPATSSSATTKSVVQEPAPVPAPAPQTVAYQYSSQLAQLKGMGFTQPDDTLKQFLDMCNGDLQNTINLLS